MPTPAYHGKGRPSGDWIYNNLLPAYHLALGRFISQFGQTETDLAVHLRDFTERRISPTGENEDLFHILLSGRRIRELRDAMRSILELENFKSNEPAKFSMDEFTTVFNHLGEIHHLRDRIAHYAVNPHFEKSETYMRALNVFSVREREKSQEILFKIEHLEAMYYDLVAIVYRVSRLLFPERHPADEATAIAQVRGERLRIADFYGPWRYKPSELKKRTPDVFSTRRKRERLRLSSRA